MKPTKQFQLQLFLLLTVTFAVVSQQADAQQRRRMMRPFKTDTAMVHDPVMAYENGTYYVFSTGRGLQMMTSDDRRTWNVWPAGVMREVPEWTHEAVPGFQDHVWAPDIIRWHGRWWLAYSCSTFGKNTSAIGLMSSPTLSRPDWADLGCIVASNSPEPKAEKSQRDDWNAIDPCFVIDDNDMPWLVYGSFWDGIQLLRLDTTMHAAVGAKPVTIARRYKTAPVGLVNPTSKYAGVNAIEAPFIYKRDGWYYLFVSWDYCCRGEKSSYNVVVGRSRKVEGPYRDRNGKKMTEGGGTLVIEGDKKDFEAAGHCAVYDLPTTLLNLRPRTLFICHGYSTRHHGQAILIQREVEWTKDGWPVLR